MRVPWPNFGGGSNVSQSSIADAQDTMNLYAEPRDVVGGKVPMALYPTPGVEARVSTTLTPGRALFFQWDRRSSNQTGRGFAVFGATLYEVSIDREGQYVLTSRGTVATDANPAIICGNGDGGGQLFLTSGGNGYCYDLTSNTLTLELTGSDTVQYTMCAFIDSYFLALDALTSTLYVSDLLDGTTWDPTQYAQRSNAADRWVALVVPTNTSEIWLLGDETSEIWSNAGTFPFPFSPVPNGRFPFGCAAPFSTKDVEGGLLWVAKNSQGQGTVVLASGSAPKSVSTFAVEQTFRGYTTISDAVGSGYRDSGHVFYVLTFPSEDVTWALDLSTRIWAKRGTWISEKNRYEAWRPMYHLFAFGVHLAVDGRGGTLYEVSASFGSDVESRPIRRFRRSPGLFKNHDTIFLSCIEVYLEMGLGVSTGTGSDPQVTMRLSRDGGKTWGNERRRSVGAIGKTLQRARFWRCGSAQDAVLEIMVTDPIPFRILDVFVTVRDEEAA